MTEQTMEQRILEIQRRMLLESKRWGDTCIRAIINGAWDRGSLVAAYAEPAEQEALRRRPEIVDE